MCFPWLIHDQVPFFINRICRAAFMREDFSPCPGELRLPINRDEGIRLALRVWPTE